MRGGRQVSAEAWSAMQFRIDESFHSLFPTAHIGMVVADGIDNQRNHEEAAAELQAAVAAGVATVDAETLAAHPAIAPWREAYRRFGMKPSRYHSSIESLLRSAHGRGIRGVNPLVDAYNAISLRHLLPCGGEDLDAIQGDLRLTVAHGGEPFVPLGATEESPPAPGEVVYADEAGIVCRGWNWREAHRTRLTERTTRAVLVIEALPPRAMAEVAAACEELAASVARNLGGTCRIALLGSNDVVATSLDA
jgi:DNA/RNA-binding domain of Phe-tRNA-synthetase-like protein